MIQSRGQSFMDTHTYEVELTGNDILHIKVKIPATSLEEAVKQAMASVSQITIEQFVEVRAIQLGLG